MENKAISAPEFMNNMATETTNRLTKTMVVDGGGTVKKCVIMQIIVYSELLLYRISSAFQKYRNKHVLNVKELPSAQDTL